jgi:hypothetical protein
MLLRDLMKSILLSASSIIIFYMALLPTGIKAQTKTTTVPPNQEPKQEPIFLSFLERDPKHPETFRLRVAFYKRHTSGWQALKQASSQETLEAGMSSYPKSVNGVVVHRGKMLLKSISARLPKKWKNYGSQGLLELTAPTTLPASIDKSGNPLVVVTKPYFVDHDVWHKSNQSDSIKSVAKRQFLQKIGQVSNCKSIETDPIVQKVTVDDVGVTDCLQSRKGALLIALKLRQTYDCDGPPGEEWMKHWYLVEEQNKSAVLLGSSMDLLDSGDYDNDGHNETLFLFSGYNQDGYVLFSNKFRNRLTFFWHYH